MRRILFILVATLFLFTACDTNPGVSKAFAKYSHKEGVTSVTVPGWLISIGASFGDLSKEERDLLDCIDKVKVLAIENDDLNARINLHKEFHAEINKNQEYEELLTVRDKDENVTIFVKMDENVIEEMIILVGGDDNVMVYLKGEIKPEMINNTIDLSHPDKFLSMKF
jgi:hypothetical protein